MTAPVSRRLHSIPAPPTRFVGRAALLAEIRAALGAHRLVTLLGPGGSGKTRLAIETAQARSGEARFVELAEATREAALHAQVARAFSVPLTGEGDADAIGARLDARGPVLVVLDNVEQLGDAAARALGSWLRAAPEASFLVTSRHRLGIGGEAVVEVPPLGLPDPSDAPERAQASEAVELFVDRVRQVRAGFALAPADVAPVARLLERLDGLPLAIELAAARFDVLGLDGLVARSDDLLALLLRGPRDAPQRHATMRAAVAWSWGLSGADERSALAQLTAFRGGFSLDAAEAVVAGERAVLERLEVLRDRSLVVARGAEGPRPRRFDLLAVIRAFVEAEPTTAPERVAAVERHARWFGALATRRVAGPSTEVQRAQLVADRDNLELALETLLASPEPGAQAEAILDLVRALERAQGNGAALARLADRALAVAGERHPARRVEVLRVRARAQRHAGDLAAARATLEAASALAAPDPAAAGALRVDLGVLHHQTRDIAEAERCYREALALHRASAGAGSEAGTEALRDAGIGRALGNLGALAHDTGRWDEARALYAEALEHLARADDLALQGRFLANLAVLELEVGRSAEARVCFEQATAALERVGDRRLLAITRGNLGLLDHQDGRLDLARAHHETALEILDEVGDPRSIVLAAARLAGVEALAGDVEQARARLADAELRALRLGDPVTAGVVALSRGFVDVAEAHRAWSRGQVEPAKAHVERALARVDEARQRPADGPLVTRSDDARTVVRLLQAAIDSAVPSAATPAAPPAGKQLRVAPAAMGFAPPGGAWQDFRRRQPLRRLLLELVEQRRRAPGKSVPAERLIEAAWPGERIAADAAANRLYVALATLRKLGLKEVVLSRDEGYVIDPAVEIVWVDGL